MMFENGNYVTTINDGKKEITGYNQFSRTDKNGVKEFTGGMGFTFNDIHLDYTNLKKSKINFLTKKDVHKSLRESGVFEQDVFSRWLYALNESNANNISGNGKLDFRANGTLVENDFYVINGVCYNSADAGNFLWGAAMGLMGFTATTTKISAHINAWWSAKGSNGVYSTSSNPLIRFIQERSWLGDSDADQRAIQNGLNFTNYWENKKRTILKLFRK